MTLFQWLRHAGAKAPQPETLIHESPGKAPVRRRYRFYGRVQGVGFRRGAAAIASRMALVGWVKNESDGSVTVEIEGAANHIDAFLMAIRAVPRFQITKIKTKKLPPLGTEPTFKVLY